MRATTTGVLAIFMVLAGCNKSVDVATPTGSPGRFAGIGVFDAGKLWGQMAGPAATNDAASAKIADDEHVIVVVDSHTGEVRQCGDHSGYCVTMNPWNSPGATLPVKLVKHASDLAADDQTATMNAPEPK